MSDDVRKKAQAALAEVEKVTQAILPEPVTALVPLETADKATGAEIKKRMAEIDMDNTGSIVGFGSRAQSGLQEISQSMLQGVRMANKAIRTEMERGVFDIEAIKSANAYLIETINESLAIADEGKRKRAATEEDLKKLEADLRDTLASAKARATGTGDTIGTATGE